MPLPLARFSLAVSIALLSPVPSHSRSHSPGDSRSHSRKSDLARSSFTCSSLDLQGTVLRQLEPFLTGITKEALSDHAKELYLESVEVRPLEPVPGYPIWDQDKAKLTNASSPDFPWSHPSWVKVTAINGTLWLPGGHIPPDKNGWSFSHFNEHLLYDLMVLNAAEPLPDMELLIAALEFSQVHSRNTDGSITPVFKASGSHDAYDLVLPDPGWRQGGASGYIPPDMAWDQRLDKVVSRYNIMCPHHNPFLPRQERGEDLEPCSRIAVHDVSNSSFNHDGVLDIGATTGRDFNLPYMTTEQQALYKYQIALDGASTPYRLRHLLEGGQAIIMDGGSPLFSWYSDALQPWVHFIPFSSPWEQLPNFARWLFKHDHISRQVAQNGQAYARCLSNEVARQYSRMLLTEYSQLLQFKPSLGGQAVTLEDGLQVLLKARADIWDNHPTLEENPVGPV